MNTARLVIAIFAICTSVVAAEVPPRYEVGTVIQYGHTRFEIKEVVPSNGTPRPLGKFLYRVAVGGFDGLLLADEIRLDQLASEGEVVEQAKPAPVAKASDSPALQPVKYRLGQIVGPTGNRYQIQGWRDSPSQPDVRLFRLVGVEPGLSGIVIESNESLVDWLVAYGNKDPVATSADGDSNGHADNRYEQAVKP